MSACRCLALFVGCLSMVGSVIATPLKIVTTFAPIQCFTLNVVRDTAETTMLLPPNTGPHDYSFSPGDIRKIAVADVVIYNGAGLESWLEKGIKNVGRRGLVIVDASKGIPLLTGAAGTGPDSSTGEEGGVNPHVWLDPRLAIREVENICDALIAVDPPQSAAYRGNAEAYIRDLQQLDEEMLRKIATIKNRNLVTFHDSFPYFAKAFGFTIVGVFEDFPGKNPSPRDVARLQDVIRRNHVSALFSEPQYSPRTMNNIAAEFHLPVVELDPMETGDGSADFYVRVMNKNLAALLSAFH